MGVFGGVDAVIFTHVDDKFGVSWGQPRGTGLVSVEYTFHGEAAHSAMHRGAVAALSMLSS
jgi:aminobenzoyl-glutamate utilization protein B